MRESEGVRFIRIFGAVIFVIAAPIGLRSAFARAQAHSRQGTTFAQKLVEATKAKHPETDEVGIAAMTARGCVGIASTDPDDIGEKCEKDDLEPMQTGKPYVEKEKDGYDVSLPLHDAPGKLVGSIGVGFKASAGQTEASVTEQARKIAAEMERQIPSKAKLLSKSE
jgi:sensor histidine kinase regulating citrate/malate metabolism